MCMSSVVFSASYSVCAAFVYLVVIVSLSFTCCVKEQLVSSHSIVLHYRALYES